jgi:hypothetical protein
MFYSRLIMLIFVAALVESVGTDVVVADDTNATARPRPRSTPLLLSLFPGW